MQARTSAEEQLVRTAPVLKRVTRVELVSRANPGDVRLVIDTSDRSYDPDQTKLQAGNVEVDVSRDAIRSVSLTIMDRTGAWLPGPGNSVWLDAMLKIYKGYVGTRLWQQGLFDVGDPEVGRRQVSIRGVDKAGRASGREQGGFTQNLSIPAGTNLVTALTTLGAVWGETMYNLVDPGRTVPYPRDFGLTDSPWRAAQEYAGIPGNFRPLYYDETGYLTWVPDPDPNLLSPVWEIWPDAMRPTSALPGEFSRYVDGSKRIDTSQLRNYVIVIGASANSAPVYAEAYDNDPNSPTSIQRIGRRISLWNGGRPDPMITTQADAQARANYELRKLLQWQERVPIRMTEVPFIQPWDVIRVADPQAGLNDTYQILRYTMPLADSAEMAVDAGRVRRAVG